MCDTVPIKLNESSAIQSLYTPLVTKLGYEYKDDESANIKQLRTLAISEAVASGDPKQVISLSAEVYLTPGDSVLDELRRRFNIAVETGDDSLIVADLEGAIYIAVRGNHFHYMCWLIKPT